MNYCHHCNKPLDIKSNFCPGCGQAQNEPGPGPDVQIDRRLPSVIIFLSVITLLGSAFGMLRGLLYQTFANFFDAKIIYTENYNRGYVLFFLNLGTFIAGILMLKRKIFGYYMYLLFQSGYIAFTFYITSVYSSYTNSGDGTINLGVNPFALLFGSFFWVPSGILLVLFLTLARKYFTKL